jgi:hypothetical protein
MKITKLIAGAGAIAAFVAVFGFGGGNASAAGVTRTWACTGSDHSMSLASNWNPAGVPTAEDELVFNGTNGSCSPELTANLEIKSITYTGNNSGFSYNITYPENYTTPYTLTVSSIVNNTTFGDDEPAFAGNKLPISVQVAVKLGADMTMKDFEFGSSSTGDSTGYGDPGYTVDLNNHTLTVVDFTSADDGNRIISFGAPIAGNGTVRLNLQKSNIQNHAGPHTFTGLFDIVDIKDGYIAGAVSGKPFGNAEVHISKSAGVSLGFDANGQTLDNKIIIAGDKVQQSLSVGTLNNLAANEIWTVSIPNIELKNDTLFMNTSEEKLVVDLKGIKANGYCIDYSASSKTTGTAAPDNFKNGATECRLEVDSPTGGTDVPGKTVPGVPATALDFIMKNPVVIALTGLIIAGAAFALIRVRKTSK